MVKLRQSSIFFFLTHEARIDRRLNATVVSVVIERQPPIITVFSPFLAFPFLSLLNRVIHVLRESRENCRAWCYRDYYSIDRFVGESRSEDLEQEREREGGRCLIKTLDHENYGTYRIREAKSDGRQCDQEFHAEFQLRSISPLPFPSVRPSLPTSLPSSSSSRYSSPRSSSCAAPRGGHRL